MSDIMLIMLIIFAAILFERNPHDEGDEWHDYRPKKKHLEKDGACQL